MNTTKNAVALLAVLAFAAAVECHARFTDVVHTHSGAVQGVILKTVWKGQEYSAFKGIPFAAPPLGALRFKAPVEVEPWTNVLSTATDAPDCVQEVNSLGSLTNLTRGTIVGSENCLYLNVFSPQTSFGDPAKIKLKPVMVWIYGGGFNSGTSSAAVYGSDFLIEDDVVVVSMNYRVGALGFLSVDHPEAPGNTGLKDQSFALRWVQKNIANFGGDPNQVTIFGQSAGASSVELHRLSPMSQGLFHRSISMSGSPLAPWSYATRKEASRVAFHLGKELGYNTADEAELINFLRTVSPEDLILATKNMSLMPLDFVFKPTVENGKVAGSEELFLEDCPFSLYKSGRFHKVSHMIGDTKDEALLVASSLTDAKKSIEYAQHILDNVGAVTEDHKGWLPKISKKISESAIRKLIKILTVILFRAPSDLTQRLTRGNMEEPVYYYRLSYETEYAMHYKFGINFTGTAHADDLAYIFNVKSLPVPKDPDHPFNQFRKKMVRLWTNFAKYGNPTPDGENDQLLGVTWLDSGHKGCQLDIDETLQMKPRMIDRKTELYERLVYLATPILTGCYKLLPSFVAA